MAGGKRIYNGFFRKMEGVRKMEYIILCGSNHEKIDGAPRQLVEICGERILDRTIRLLRENGVEQISITATDPDFDGIDANIVCYDSTGPWIRCFPYITKPTTFIFGDVYFSEQAIKTIVETPTDSIEFFASAPPFATNYPKPWAEPFAFKVENVGAFNTALNNVYALLNKGAFRRDPIAWELWQVIKGTPINQIDFTNYTAINDSTSDIDTAADVDKLRRML